MKPSVIRLIFVFCLGIVLTACQPEYYHSCANVPGLKEYYKNFENSSNHNVSDQEARKLLEAHKPRIVLSPGEQAPIDFYRNYLPRTRLCKYPEKIVQAEIVSKSLLEKVKADMNLYLDFDENAFKKRAHQSVALY